MNLLALGVNHQTCPLAVRERLAIDAEALPTALGALRAALGLDEVAIISTCNRTEIFVRGTAPESTQVAAWLAQWAGLSAARVEEYSYAHRDQAAVNHLYRVACGLDSMILGEPQILGQIKEAYHRARAAGTLGGALERLFQSAFSTAKRVRTETRIGANPVSVAFASVKLAQQVFGDLRQVQCLLIGAGDTIELAARHLAELGVKRLTIANRTVENAQWLAERCHGRAVPLHDLASELPDADLVIASTAARSPIISRSQLRTALASRRHRPMLVVDLGVPRDVEPQAADLDDLFLYNVDDLAGVIEDNLRSRREAALEAQAIIELAAEHYMAWWRGSEGLSVVRDLRARAESQRVALLDRALAQIDSGRDPKEVLRRFGQSLTNRLLHPPSIALRAAARRGDLELLNAAERLFQDGAPMPTDDQSDRP